MSSRLFNLFTHLVLAFELEDIRYEIQGVLVIRNFSVETSKVESIRQVFFIDFAKVFIASGRYELQRQSQPTVESFSSVIALVAARGKVFE